MCWNKIALCSEIRTKPITSLLTKRDLTLIIVVYRVTTRLCRVKHDFVKGKFVSSTLTYSEY